jgi:SWI/SNF-related matrix-associated actin-dependent regulator 1 of chromatin subfamily A
MISPAQRDWFLADRSSVTPLLRPEGAPAEIGGVMPGLKLKGANYLIHRTHLPLLTGDPEATRILVPDGKPDWLARNLATVERGFTLRNVQHAAVDYISTRRGVLLGDDMRVGKTLAAIMSHDPATGPLHIICPAMVRPVWISWLSRVFPDEPIGVLKGRKFDPKVWQHKLVVGHYDILPYWQSAKPIGTLIFDEAHTLTHRNTARSKAAVFLASRAAKVICATGTPIWNMPPDLWNILGMLAPGAFGNYHEFAQRYGKPVPTAYGMTYTGVSHHDELHARLSEVMIRRRWMDVITDLPPITRNVALVELTVPQRRKLDIMAAELRMNKGATIGTLASYRKQLSNIKLATAVKEAEAMLDRGEPVVIWTWHVELAEKIAEALTSRAHLLTGSVPNDQRDQRIAAWRESPTATALVCTMAVAQVGLDFSHAHLALFVEIDYTPAILAQAEMRTFAPERPMNVTYVVADHIVDQRIIMALVKKLGAANPLGVGAANDAITSLQHALFGAPEEPDMDLFYQALLEA